MPDGYVPEDQYKNLQRQLEAARKEKQEWMTAAIQLNDVHQTVTRMEEGIASFFDAQVEYGGLDEAKDFKQTASSLKERRTRDAEVSKKQREVTEVLSDAGVDWSDPRLERARESWDKGELDTAITSIKDALKDEKEGAESRKRLANTKRVDTGDSTVTAEYDPSMNAQTLKTLMKDRAWWKKNKERVMADLASGRLRNG